MRLIDLLRGLRHHVILYPALNRITGSNNATLLMTFLVYRDDTHEAPGAAISHTEITEYTGLSRKEQEMARAALVERGIIYTALRGVPATTHYTVNADQVSSLWDPDAQNAQLVAPVRPDAQNAQLDGDNAQLVAQNEQQDAQNAQLSIREEIEEPRRNHNDPSPTAPAADGVVRSALGDRKNQIAALWRAQFVGTRTAQLNAPQIQQLIDLEDQAYETGNAQVYGVVDAMIKTAATDNDPSKGTPFKFAVWLIRKAIDDAKAGRPPSQREAEEEYPPTLAELAQFDHIMLGKMRRQEYEKRVQRAQHAAQTGGWLSDDDKAAIETAKRERGSKLPPKG